MNVDQIYQLQRDNAFAKQFSATKYHTFLAMPFNNRGGYPEPRIRKMLEENVYRRANDLLVGWTSGKRRTFDPLQRVGAGLSGAIDITEQIVTDILNCHFFLGDLTGSNFGVVFESGLALALKPNSRVLLFTQDDLALLHFDVKPTNINKYGEDDLIEMTARALVGAAEEFELEADRYIRLLSTQLTPDGISLLNIYGRRWKDRGKPEDTPSIWEDSAAAYSRKRFDGPAGSVAFHNAVRELSDRRLFWTQYVADDPPGSGSDRYGIHATNLGWRVIEHIWWKDPKMRQAENAPTGPTFD